MGDESAQSLILKGFVSNPLPTRSRIESVTTLFLHPLPLRVAAGKVEIGKANDIWSQSGLPINVAEYDFKPIVTQLETDRPLELNLPVKGDRLRKLQVPPFAVREWRSLLDKS